MFKLKRSSASNKLSLSASDARAMFADVLVEGGSQSPSESSLRSSSSRPSSAPPLQYKVDFSMAEAFQKANIPLEKPPGAKTISEKYHELETVPVPAGLDFTKDYIRFNKRSNVWEKRTFPAKVPGKRDDAKKLAQVLESLMKTAHLKRSQRVVTTDGKSFDAELIRDEFSALDSVFAEAIRQTRTECRERAEILESLRQKYTDLVADLLASVFRNLHSAENFTQFRLQADKERYSLLEMIRNLKESEAQFQNEMTGVKEAHEREIKSMKEKIEETKKWATKAREEANNAQQDAVQFQTQTQDWYDWEMKHLEDRAEQLDLRNQMLLQAKIELHDKVSQLQDENAILRSGGTVLRYREDACTQTDAIPSSHQTYSPRSTPKTPMVTFGRDVDPMSNAFQQENFEMMRKAATEELRMSNAIPIHSWFHFVEFGHGSLVQRVTLDRWITGVYEDKILQDEEYSKLGKPLMDLGSFIVVHFRKKFGLRTMSESYLGDLVFSIKALKNQNERVRMFADLVGIEPALPYQAQSLYLKLTSEMNNISKSELTKKDSEVPVVWDRLPHIEALVDQVLSDKGRESCILIKARIGSIAGSEVKDGKSSVIRVNRDEAFRLILEELLKDEMERCSNVATQLLSAVTVDSGFSKKTFTDFISFTNPSLDKRTLRTAWLEALQSSGDAHCVSAEQFLDVCDRLQLGGGDFVMLPRETKLARRRTIFSLERHWQRWNNHIEERLLALWKRQQRSMFLYKRLCESLATHDSPLIGWICMFAIIKDLGLEKQMFDPKCSLKSVVRNLMMSQSFQSEDEQKKKDNLITFMKNI